jgi:hypothetical protein
MVGFIDYPPPIFYTHWADNAILYWGIREYDNKFRMIERSEGNDADFKVISVLSPDVPAYTDANLTTGECYYYRSYLTNFQTVTPYSPILFVVTNPELFRYSEITIDGNADDWNAIEPVLSLYNNISTYTIRIFTDTKNLNILVKGSEISGFELFIETDNDPATGTKIQTWNTDGVDYRISYDSLFSFQEGWTYKTRLSDHILNDSVIELSIPFDEISLGDIAAIRTGITIYTESGTLFLPFQDKSLAIYNRVLPTCTPTGFHLVSSSVDPASRIIIRWDKCSDCSGNIIEKLDEEEGSFEILAELDYKAYQYIDDSLENHKEYSYRMYSYNPAGRSEYTRTLTGYTRDVGISELDSDDRFQVYTDFSSQKIIIRINEPELTISSAALYDFSGRQVNSSKHFKGEQELSISLQDLSPGIYLLLLKYRDGSYSETILNY